MPQKPSIRVRVSDGKPREWKKLKAALGTFVDVRQDGPATCFWLATHTERQLTELRPKLGALGLEELAAESHVTAPSIASPTDSTQKGQAARSTSREAGSNRISQPTVEQGSRKKPYSFVSLPESFDASDPVWHDGSGSTERLSGEIRFEIKNLTPLLVGWERQKLGEPELSDSWPIEFSSVGQKTDGTPIVDSTQLGVTNVVAGKSIIYPLRAPWQHGPVLIPGDSIKGLLRHELGALLGAPMERVAERAYSYRPNLRFPDSSVRRRLEPRLARVLTTNTLEVMGATFPVPETVDILSMATRDQQKYYPGRHGSHAPSEAGRYQGGMGGGEKLPAECLSDDAAHRTIHTQLYVVEAVEVDSPKQQLTRSVLDQYRRTLEHYLSPESGHFSNRHPQVGNKSHVRAKGIAAVKKAAQRAFGANDLIWVEWDTQEEKIVSFGWHYYYRWAYEDSIRMTSDEINGVRAPRTGLFPLLQELPKPGEQKPSKLSAVRRLFGYAADQTNEGTLGIGVSNYSQLMGRISVNAAIEVIQDDQSSEKNRFLGPTFLKELGQPKPSAVEHYLEQPTSNASRSKYRPTDKASLVTYGDAAGYDKPGKLAGRKFYLDRADAYTQEPWVDDSASNRLNERSTLAIQASRPNQRFRFTLRFRDLEPAELAAVLLALCPDQFAKIVGGNHKDGYCSKLGYARPLGWGSVCVVAKELHLLSSTSDPPVFSRQEPDMWFHEKWRSIKCPLLSDWLGVHRQKHPNAGDYPRKDGEIFTYHTQLRADHSRERRYENGSKR